MRTTTKTRPSTERSSRPERLAGPAFVFAGITFFIGGLTHPTDSGHGNKVQQLHDMLVSSSWYPSHALLLVAMVLFAFAISATQRQRDLRPDLARFLPLVFVVGCVATVSMTVHLLAALGASSVADGKPSLLSAVQNLNEAIDAVWGLAIAALAVIGGRNGSLGNRLTLPLGAVGGLAFALGSATIPYTDSFDPAFKIGSLVSVWALAVGVMALPRLGMNSAEPGPSADWRDTQRAWKR